jgi:signal transduction histidine kinase
VVNNIKSDYDKPYDVVGIRKDGTRFTLEIRGKNIPYRDGGTIRITEFRDISERKLAESQILEQNAKLVAITHDLQTKNDQLHEFAQIVSHNLRSPVGNILSLLSLISNAENETEKNEYFQLLEESGTTTLTTLNELNEVLQINENKDIERQELEFANVFDHVFRLLNARIAKADAGIVTDFSQVPKIHYPNIYLESILLNLLSNALKYAHPNRKPEISLMSFIRDGRVVLTVSDNGLGINMEKYSHQVFKLRKTFHRHPESRGIGLFMIKNQIVALGGDITVSSIENEGSTFTITF